MRPHLYLAFAGLLTVACSSATPEQRGQTTSHLDQTDADDDDGTDTEDSDTDTNDDSKSSDDDSKNESDPTNAGGGAVAVGDDDDDGSDQGPALGSNCEVRLITTPSDGTCSLSTPAPLGSSCTCPGFLFNRPGKVVN